MLVRWADLEALITRELDEDSPPDNILTAVNGALRAFCSHTAFTNIYRATVGESHSLLLPSDFLEMHGVKAVAKGLLMYHYPAIPDDAEQALGWYEFPMGTLQLPTYQGAVEVYYYAYYPEVTGDPEQNIPIPLWAIRPIIYMTCAYIATPGMISDGRLNQFNTRLDSGTPEDIPLKILIDFLRKQYEIELGKFPPQKRELMHANPRRSQ